MREYRYRVDAEGRIFHDGSEVLDPLTLRLRPLRAGSVKLSRRRVCAHLDNPGRCV